SDVARRFIAKYGGDEAGSRQVTGDEVVWDERPLIRMSDSSPAATTDQQSRLQQLVALHAAALSATNSGFQGFVAPQDVPGSADVQVMCAVVIDGKIHAVIALAEESERSCHAAEPNPGTGFPWVLVVATSIASLSWLGHRSARQPPTGRRP